MPEISGWDGVQVWINWHDHAPPHFHAWYSGLWIVVEIATGDVKRWKRDKPWPAAELRRLERWRQEHEAELAANWVRVQAGEAPERIAPAPSKGKKNKRKGKRDAT